jgi:two-component system nitrate/nitrite response regulator NarL
MSGNSSQTVKLSNREKQVLSLLQCGYTNKVIARELSIAEATVKVFVRSILQKARAKNRTEVAIWAVNHGVGRVAVRYRLPEIGRATIRPGRNAP